VAQASSLCLQRTQGHRQDACATGEPGGSERLEVRLLGHDKPLAWEPEGEGIRVRLPSGPLPCRHAWVLRIEGIE
jgi:hypothetical protein